MTTRKPPQHRGRWTNNSVTELGQAQPQLVFYINHSYHHIYNHLRNYLMSIGIGCTIWREFTIAPEWCHNQLNCFELHYLILHSMIMSQKQNKVFRVWDTWVFPTHHTTHDKPLIKDMGLTFKLGGQLPPKTPPRHGILRKRVGIINCGRIGGTQKI